MMPERDVLRVPEELIDPDVLSRGAEAAAGAV